MTSVLRRGVAFTSKNGSSIIAISSLLIAMFSLYVTIQSQMEDRAYKELLIKPALAIRARTENFSVALVNDGLGPAEVKNIIYQFGSECLSMIKDDTHYNRENYYKAVNALKIRLFDEVFSFKVTSTDIAVAAITGRMVMPGIIIGASKETVLFGIFDPTVEAFRAKINALDPKLAQSLKDDFTVRALTLPISIKYCSISGKYCHTVVRDSEDGATCKFGT